MSPPEQNGTVPDEVELERLCVAFLASRYYRKAINDIRYVREQAIRDFLREQLPGTLTTPALTEEVVAAIRKNYYRYF